jgi:dTDP-4-dehydrorhamnose 3,5-epimerase
MNILDTTLPDVLLIEPRVFGDDRGWFFESYNLDTFTALGIDAVFVQDNHSYSTAGVLRGLHFQRAPQSMAKLVRCGRGRIWDVAVDLRPDSPTYMQWYGTELSAENKRLLFIPAGFGHGFYALEDSELLYKCTATFHASLDGGVAWDDPQLAITWPIDGTPLLSDKDRALPTLSDAVLIW